MFRFYVKSSSGGSKTTFIPHPMLILALYCAISLYASLNHLKTVFKTCIKTHSIKSFKNFVKFRVEIVECSSMDHYVLYTPPAVLFSVLYT
jgi:hypothetical protein